MSGQRVNKRKVLVQVQLNDGTELLGYIFVLANQQRVSDLLNDGRRFLPFLGSDGLTHFLRVEGIARVAELHQEVNQSIVIDPYEFLGVSASITDDELLNVYHDLCMRFHPDRVGQYDLPREMMATATTMTVRIIDAFNRIKKARAPTSRKHANGA